MRSSSRKKIPKISLGERPPLGELLHKQNQFSAEVGYEWLSEFAPEGKRFEEHMRRKGEEDLYFFSKFVMGMEDEVGHLHGRVARWLQDGGYGKAKLLMMAMGHLKTSLCTRSQTLHFLVQSAADNIYIPGMAGGESRLLIASESEPKSRENLTFIKSQLERNIWIRWLWPQICWEDPKESPRWTDHMLEVPRTTILAEPTITSVGRGTGIYQRHYDAMWLDDIVGMEDAESVIVMESAKRWRRGLITRGHIPTDHWEFGVGTPWGVDDVYSEWAKELPEENVMVIPAMEEGRPVWPERYSVEKLSQIRKRIGDQLFSLGYMVKAVKVGFSALAWEDLREFKIESGERGQEVVFRETGADEGLGARVQNFAGLMALRRGDPLRLAYPVRARNMAGSNWSPEFLEFMKGRYPERFEVAERERKERGGRP